MKLIVGLGNPGRQYAYTRHNVGFMCLDTMLKNFSISPHVSRKLQAIYYTVRIPPQGEIKAILAKPQTYMNSAGMAVKKLLYFFNIDFKDLLVIHDDIDLKIGVYKIQKGRGAAGHKGVQSVIDNLLTSDFTRIRIGVNRPVVGIDPERYVLQKFRQEERKKLDEVLGRVLKSIEKLLVE